MFTNTVAFIVVFTVAVAGAILAPLTNAPEPTTWILSMAVLTAVSVGFARPARGERLPPGVA